MAVFDDQGCMCTRLPAWMPTVYPIGSERPAQEEHPEGIVLTSYDADKAGLNFEFITRGFPRTIRLPDGSRVDLRPFTITLPTGQLLRFRFDTERSWS